MLTLAIETASLNGSLALFKDKHLLASQSWTSQGSHSEALFLVLDKALADAQVEIRQLQRLAVNIGPGSFTGLRVGVGFARTLGYSLNIPIFNICGLELLAHQPALANVEKVRIAQYAFRDLIYTAEYKLQSGNWTLVEAPLAVTASALTAKIDASTPVIGSGLNYLDLVPAAKKKILDLRPENCRDFPLAEDFRFTVALDSSLAIETNDLSDKSRARLTNWIHTIPLYIRASEAEEKLKLSALKST